MKKSNEQEPIQTGKVETAADLSRLLGHPSGVVTVKVDIHGRAEVFSGVPQPFDQRSAKGAQAALNEILPRR